MRIEERGLVFDANGRPVSERITCFTGMCPLSSGALLCGFQIGASKHAPTSTIRLCRSRDDGRTWSEIPYRFETSQDGVPGSLAGAELVEAEPGRLLAFTTWFDRSEPDRPLFDPDSGGILHSKQLMAVSGDEGETWSEWRELTTAGLTGTAATGPALRWTDGAIAFAFESFKEIGDSSPARHGAWVLLSRDGGHTFSDPVLIAEDPGQRVYYWDQRLCAGAGPGQYVALFWTHDLDRKQDLTVHLRAGSIAGDDFESAPIRATPIPGQIAAPLLLDDGRLLAFVVDRRGPCTMKLWSSSDGGVTWPEEDALVVYTHEEKAAVTQGAENVDFDQYWQDMGKWSFGHPTIRPLDSDHVLLAHYAGTPDRMSIHWIRVNVA